MHEFMVKIGYTLINDVSEYNNFCARYFTYYGDNMFFARGYEESDFPLYMKEVITDDNGYGVQILNFSTVDPKTVAQEHYHD